MAHNKFSDWTQDEKDALLSLKKDGGHSRGRLNNENPLITDVLASIDDDFYGREYDLGDGDSCEQGFYYYWRSNTCRECREGCWDCSDRNECNACMNEEMTASNGKCTCPDGPLLDDNTCGTDCGDGYYFHRWNGVCRECGWNCELCDSWYNCNQCLNGYHPKRGFCYCESGNFGPDHQCLAGDCSWSQYLVGEECVDCPLNCDTCEDETGMCYGCVSNFELNADTNECACSEGLYDIGGECGTCDSATYYDGYSCADCPDNCLECVDGTGMCTTCKDTYFTDDNGWCFCPTDTHFEENGYCTEIPDCYDGQFFNGNTCTDCGDRCASCSDISGICNECSAIDENLVLDTNTCKCPETMYDNGQTCEDYVACEEGSRVDASVNECVACDEGCAVCMDYTGECMECVEPNFTVNSRGECTDPDAEPDCTDYGLVENPSGCYEGRYSDDRLIPPYAEDSESVDWRDWGLVNSIRD